MSIKNVKRLAVSVSTSVGASLASLAHAAGVPTYTTVALNAGQAGIRDIIGKIANIFGTLIMGISVLMILYAAFLFLTAQGSEDKVKSARNTLVYALVGVAVALVAFSLPTLVKPLITG